MPAYGALTARAAEAVADAPVHGSPRRPVDRDVIDIPGRQAAGAPHEGEVYVTAYRQQLGRPERH